MPFTAVCLHCRGSKFRVPFKKRGTFATCPKCAHEFMLVPASGVDVPLMEYKELPFDDHHEPSPASTAEIRILEDDAPPTATAETTATDTQAAARPLPPLPKDGSDPAVRMALASFAFVGVGMIASQFPYGRFVAAPLAGIGLLVAAGSLLGLDKSKWLGWAGVGLNALGLLFVLILPSWLGLSIGWTPSADPEAAPKPVTAVGRDGSLPKTAEWVDAGKDVWQQGDVRITVVGVTVGPADPTSKDADKRKERVVRVTLKLTNVGVARALEFTSWSPAPTIEPKLTTAAGTPLAQKPSATEKATVYPGKSAESVLTFAAPEKADDLKLELPPQAFGGTDPARILIPKSLFGGR